MTLTPQWCNSLGNYVDGPMNRECVFADQGCDGTKNSLMSGVASLNNIVGGTGYVTGSYVNKPFTGGLGTGATGTFVVDAIGVVISVSLVNPGTGYAIGEILTVSNTHLGGTGSGFNCRVNTLGGTDMTVSFMYNNAGAARTVHMGIGADNRFKLLVNGTMIADSAAAGAEVIEFKMWHIFPVTIAPGINYVNAVLYGSGTINDAIAIVGYDNTAAQIFAATDDDDLNIMFRSGLLRGSAFEIATCPTGYSLDVSGGVGAYTCVKVETKPCNTLV
jgi:hypothetical protein